MGEVEGLSAANTPTLVILSAASRSDAKSKDEGRGAHCSLAASSGSLEPSQTLHVKSYFVYMVRCSDGSFYVGVTNDADHRVDQHNIGTDPECYTFSRRPVTLVHASHFYDVVEAIRWEKQLKGWSRAKKQALVLGDWAAIHNLARPTSRRVR